MTRRLTKPGFTLVELMISIALVVVLMLGITKVFSLTSQTAGATNQMSSAMRDARAAQAEMTQDFSSALRDGSPFMTLYSVSQPAFRNKADRDSDRDFSVTDPVASQWNEILTVDLNGDNKEGDLAVPGEIISPATYNYRNHRLDTFSFFARHRFERQTGGIGPAVTDSPLVSQMNSNEAYVWYGHLWLPNNQDPGPVNPNTVAWPAPLGTVTADFPRGIPSVTFPGQFDTTTLGEPTKSNPNNYYATQWMLGRVATLLVPPDPTANQIKDLSGAAQRFIVHDPSGDASGPGPLDLTPLQAGAYDANSGLSPAVGNATSRFQWSRYDLAGTSIDAYRIKLYNWVNDLPRHAGAAGHWFDRMMCADVINTPDGLTGGRFQANPVFSTPIDAQKLSRQSPIFLPACTQFIVEYAGDYLQQDTNPASATYGQVTNAYCPIDVDSATPPNVLTPPATDGVIDFVVVTDPVTFNKTQRIRWYGLARNVDTSDDTAAGPVITGSAANLDASKMPDVVPLRDVIRSAAVTAAAAPSFPTSGTFRGKAAAFSGTSFERYVPPVKSNYAAPQPTGMSNGDFYTCAWGPTDPKPKMIRILMTIDDPNGKLTDGQTFEYIFTLP